MNKFLTINTKTLQDYGVSNYQELWHKVKGEFEGLSAQVTVDFVKAEDKPNRYKVTFSTNDKDRHHDFVEQNFDLKHFKKNPVLIDSHNYNSIEHIIGRVKKISQKPTLAGEVEFATVNPKGALAKEMVDGGFISATSIGFVPLEFGDDGKINKSELLEISLVSVPANPYALFEKTVAEVEDIKKTVEPETPAEVVIETVQKINRRKFILDVLAREIQTMQSNNLAKQKRNVLKALRSLK